MLAELKMPQPRKETPEDGIPSHSPLAPVIPVQISAESLGSKSFRQAYGIRYAYVAGAMYNGIASVDLIKALAQKSMLGFLGTGGLRLDEIETALNRIRTEIIKGGVFGANLLAGERNKEFRTVELYLRLGIRHIEAAAYVSMTPALVYYRLAGMERAQTGEASAANRILAKVSRPEIARQFMSPPPAGIVDGLVAEGRITPAQAELGRQLPMADDICVEADSGGHTDQGVAFTLLPAMIDLRDRLCVENRYPNNIHVGAAGGIGVPGAAAAAFMMGADFILTGSINQCTVEAGTSPAVKSLLDKMDVQDTDYAPAGDMFEAGARVQVLKKGVLFPARANKLYELYSRYQSLEDIPPQELDRIQQRYFGKSIAEVWQECREYLLRSGPERLDEVENNPRKKMAAVFKWYFSRSTRLALAGDESRKLDFQIQCGPALGAFNAWVRGTPLERWQNRHVADIGEMLMRHTAELLAERFNVMANYRECV